MRVESTESGARDDNGETVAKGAGGRSDGNARPGRARRGGYTESIGRPVEESESRTERETWEKETTKQSGVPLCPAAQRRAQPGAFAKSSRDSCCPRDITSYICANYIVARRRDARSTFVPA